MMNDSEDASRASLGNQEIVAALREIFAAALVRLTPEVEPASVYLPTLPGLEGATPSGLETTRSEAAE